LALRFGIAGFGVVGKLCFEILRRRNKSALTAIIDPAFTGADFRGVPVFPDASDAFAATDALIIATPPNFHFDLAVGALKSGKHVFVEKPATRSLVEALALVDLSKYVGRTLFFAYHASYNRCVSEAATALRHERILSLRALFRENVREFHRNSWVLREGALRDSGINVFSILTAILPSASQLSVAAANAEVSPAFGSDVRTDIQLLLDGSSHGSIHLDWLSAGAEQRLIEVLTPGERLDIDIARDVLTRDDVRVEDYPPEPGLEAEYSKMIDHFIDCILARRSHAPLKELELLDSAIIRAGIHNP
jgi:D-galactose 1-dehydrogenase